ncbi:MAG: winged helix-turn-helix transcriptional regulator [Alphaproteobacteria bacterium]|nr:winged helix-turn-helix transcriptional regulator [Alphaproteobacteria bacterium]
MNRKASSALADLGPRAAACADFLKGLANEHRLLILCALAEGPKNVAALIAVTGIAPSSMSQHLAKLKAEGIVAFEREHRTLTYAIAHPATAQIMRTLHSHFCGEA